MQISNIVSVSNAFKKIGVETKTTTDVNAINNATGIILPGVGAFEEGINFLNNNGLSDVIRRRVSEKGVPILGICLGMQLLADTSTEHGNHDGLGLVGGQVIKLDPVDPAFRVPNIGWNSTNPTRHGRLFEDLKNIQSFYYVHSYHIQCKNKKDIAATITYGGVDVTGAVEKDNIFGVQFHPEKSQDAGLDLLYRFVSTLHG